MVDPSLRPRAKTAHVNMMTDTIIANLPADLLRSIVRAVLTVDPGVTPILEDATRTCLRKTASTAIGDLFTKDADSWRVTPEFIVLEQRIRAMMGCGLVYECLPLLCTIVGQANELPPSDASVQSPALLRELASIDADMVQALTAVQKSLMSSTGTREPTPEERQPLTALLTALQQTRQRWVAAEVDNPFERSAETLASLLGEAEGQSGSRALPLSGHSERPTVQPDTFKIGQVSVPRLFSGLWQLSSPSWGFASAKQMSADFVDYVSQGFTAFDMADHYGDAEVIFGRLRASYERPEDIFGATKYCVFHPITVTPEVIQANVTERCRRMGSKYVDLLQFHWQYYNDRQYIEALRLLQQDKRVRHLGLCNFDTKHMKEVLDSGIEVATNQVQFSLIDARPRFDMDAICTSSGVKLLTYGTLCGGFLAAKWLGQPEPPLFSEDMTPSQRKYLEMILAWGDWTLFQTLLKTLQQIGTKHNVTVANVATRWVLDFPYVGAILVGARLGVSQHAAENLKAYGWTLDEDDQAQIEAVLAQSRRQEMFEAMGDCGSEYR